MPGRHHGPFAGCEPVADFDQQGLKPPALTVGRLFGDLRRNSGQRREDARQLRLTFSKSGVVDELTEVQANERVPEGKLVARGTIELII